MGRVRRTAVVLAVGALLVGGYGVADAADVVPGVVTTAPRPPEPEPFPTVALPEPLRAPVVTGPDGDAPVPTAAALQALAAGFEDDDRRTGSFSLVIADATTGEVLLDHDGATPRIPASSLKILTAAAALDALGVGSTLTTSAVLDGGTVVLVGGGDVLLAAGEGDPGAVSGRAGLADLAAEAAAALTGQGVTSVAVAVDHSLFAGPVHHPDWAGADLSYVMPVQPLAVDRGRARVGYVDDPALQAGQVFAEALAARGVAVTSVGRRAAPADAQPLGDVRSATVGEIVRYTLKASDNSTAEVLAHLVAVDRGQQADFAGASAAVRQQLAELGLDTTGVTMVDGSGLSEGNRVPAATLVDLMALAAEPASTSLHGLLPAMPVAGLDGTLADRLRSAAAGDVRAKTGTLIRAISLTGTVRTDDGRALLFSLVNDGVEPGAVVQARLAVDAWATSLAACGCS